MRILLTITLLFSLLSAGCCKESENTDKSITIAPKLPYGFATICSVSGKFQKIDPRAKGASCIDCFSVESVNGQPFSKIISILSYYGSATSTPDDLLAISKKNKITLWGYETIHADGIPDGLCNYMPIPQARSWGISTVFVVIKFSADD